MTLGFIYLVAFRVLSTTYGLALYVGLWIIVLALLGWRKMFLAPDEYETG